ncbi:anaerobic ribonucleoside-triphosphate reductase activating protein [Synergistaceae bacterium OttesenSCG-928-D05]|nr:anaerobic ribonucleoside-triphosphate reductase activating protein [Synergistaceae bacterium OttesenSCG-928-D05]
MTDFNDLQVGGYLPTSFLDWDGHVAAVLFTQGCNFRCPWCHNGDLVLGRAEPILLQNVLADIEKRKKFLDGVVVSGGEPTIWGGFLPLLYRFKEIGLPVKLDTNGSNPELLRRVLGAGLVHHVAMDVKAPFGEDAYAVAAGVPIDEQKIKDSLTALRLYAPSYELRTTWSPALLSEEQLLKIQTQLGRDKNWVVQAFLPDHALDPACRMLAKAEAEQIRRLLPSVKVRG